MSRSFGRNSSFARSIDAVGWALFFVWAGTAMLAGVGWTWSLVGTALIILGVQLALFLRGESLDIFMIALGVVLLVGAIIDLLGSAWSLIPAFLVVIGIAMLADALRTGARHKAPRT